MNASVGRIVRFNATEVCQWAAIITSVRDSSTVDLTVFAPGRAQMHRQAVPMGAEAGSWSWPTIEAPTPDPEQEEDQSE